MDSTLKVGGVSGSENVVPVMTDESMVARTGPDDESTTKSKSRRVGFLLTSDKDIPMVKACGKRSLDYLGGSCCATCMKANPNPRQEGYSPRSIWFCKTECQNLYLSYKPNMLWGQRLDSYVGSEKLEDERRVAAKKRVVAKLVADRARAARTASKKPKTTSKNKEETCSICQCEFMVGDEDITDGDKVGLCCPSSHHMCSECSGVYVNSIVGNLETNYPPKCPVCTAVLPSFHFETKLTMAQLVTVKAFAAKHTLLPGQSLNKCEDCGFFEIQKRQLIDNDVWWCKECGKGICNICNKDLPREAYRYGSTSSPLHPICHKLRFAKEKIEAAIEAGSKMACPECGLAGRKDDACTHMTCPNCSTIWCYVCGLDVRVCDKALPNEMRPMDHIYLHNVDWETKEARCPMYLTQILEVDLSWLGEDWENRASDEDFEDDNVCLDHFHGFRTLKKLQEAYGQMDPEEFFDVFENFDSVKNAGYTIDDIFSTRTDNLIDRGEYIRALEEEEEDADEGGDGIGNNHDADGDGPDSDDNSDEISRPDENDDEFEVVPERMTQAVIQEEEEVRRALDESRQLVRDSVEEETEETDVGHSSAAGQGSEGSVEVPNEVADASERVSELSSRTVDLDASHFSVLTELASIADELHGQPLEVLARFHPVDQTAVRGGGSDDEVFQEQIPNISETHSSEDEAGDGSLEFEVELDESGDEFETLPEEMTQSAIQEENNMMVALHSSRMSLQEDERWRRVVRDSMVRDEANQETSSRNDASIESREEP